MQRPSETNYHETLREVGNRAGAAVEEIYDDLQEHINVIRNISSDRRSALAKQVQSLYDVCRMSGSFCSHSSDCIGILNLSSFYLPGSSLRDDRAVQTAIQKIKNCSDFFASECLDLLQKAVDWSISFAAGSDARKTAFLQDISQGKDNEFLRDVLNTYRSNNESADLRGHCGYSIGSREYLNYMERKVPLQDLPAIYSSLIGSGHIFCRISSGKRVCVLSGFSKSEAIFASSLFSEIPIFTVKPNCFFTPFLIHSAPSCGDGNLSAISVKSI